jgi:hypothetical protein
MNTGKQHLISLLSIAVMLAISPHTFTKEQKLVIISWYGELKRNLTIKFNKAPMLIT